MEWNKDEDTRAKEIAESKFSSKDVKGVKKYMFKGAVLDVHVAAENNVSGEETLYE